ncbi:alpha/beta hydrolase [Nocardia vermiculata]|uniref:Alpha/beta hydrolase n=1 Tax=Nocardia vermiculata TaxID=257274 RepID=A0A846Y8E0_9NOCA|nr:alpha/beta fold hydrolase [Nocardia vermiculata]NKY54001.1 alpha/beta hydrolase [Nocardia vermiculata]
MTDYQQVGFTSNGTTCDGWYFAGPAESPFDGPDGRPVVVMAHGFGGTKDSGLEPFARQLSDAGLAVFAFDYRGFGASGGELRQRVSMAEQAEDYRAALAAAAGRPGVDPKRLVVWGVSLSGGHALTVAADRPDICAVVAVVPLVNGMAAGRVAFGQVGAAALAKSTVTSVRSALAGKLGGRRVMMPLVGRPGEPAALTAEGYYDSYTAIAGPTWRNEVDAAIGVELGGYRADRAASRIIAPVLVQIADFDRAAPPHASAKAGFAARAEVRHYPCDHFDVFAGGDFFEAAVQHQVHFLTRHLAPNQVPA